MKTPVLFSWILNRNFNKLLFFPTALPGSIRSPWYEYISSFNKKGENYRRENYKYLNDISKIY